MIQNFTSQQANLSHENLENFSSSRLSRTRQWLWLWLSVELVVSQPWSWVQWRCRMCGACSRFLSAFTPAYGQNKTERRLQFAFFFVDDRETERECVCGEEMRLWLEIWKGEKGVWCRFRRRGWVLAEVVYCSGEDAGWSARVVVCWSGEGCGWPAGVVADHAVRGVVWLCMEWLWCSGG